MTQPTQPHDIQPGDRVIAIDEAWLWGSPNYTLRVMQVGHSTVSASKQERLLTLSVEAKGGKPFTVRQFAKDYMAASPELLQERTERQLRQGLIPAWRRPKCG